MTCWLADRDTRPTADQPARPAGWRRAGPDAALQHRDRLGTRVASIALLCLALYPFAFYLYGAV